MMKRRILATTAAVALTLSLGGQSAAASDTPSKSSGELRKVLLTTQQIASFAGMEYRVGLSGIGCAVDIPIKATFCQYRRLASPDSRIAGVPWASHLAIKSFGTPAEAQTFFAGRTAHYEKARVMTSTSTAFVAYQADAQLNDGYVAQIAPQASAFQRVGSDVVFAACADSRRPINVTAVVECAESLAAAQASAVG